VTANGNGGGFSRGFFACCGAAPIIRHSVGVGTGAVTENQGVAMYDSSPTLEYVTGTGTGAAGRNIGVVMVGATASPVVRNVACRGIGATDINWGCLANVGAQPNMSEITADAFGGNLARGVEDDGAGVGASLSQVRAGGSGASVENTGIRIGNCSPRAVNIEAFANGSGTSVVSGLTLADSASDVSHVSASAGGTATGITSGILIQGATAPTLSHATVFAGGGGESLGLQNDAAGTPSVRDSVFTAAASGPATVVSVGVYTSQPINLVNVSTNTAGSGFNYGAYVASPPAAVRLVNTRLVGGATGGFGLVLEGTGTTNVDRSTLSGNVGSIYFFPSSTASVRVAVSQLISPVTTGAGTLSCLSSYNGVYGALNATCQ
jgi:hypothetical protein